MKPTGKRFPHSLSKTLILADFLAASYMGRYAVGFVAVASALCSLLLTAFGFERGAVKASISISSILYALIASTAVAGVADELETGRALIHLSQPVTKRSYVLSWVTVGPLLLTAAYLAAVLTPVLVIDPRLAVRRGVVEAVAYGAGEILYLTVAAYMFALLSRRRSSALMATIALTIIAPVLASLALAIASSILEISISSDDAALTYMVMHPIAASWAESATIRVLGLAYSYIVPSIVLLLVTLMARRLEV